MTTHTVQQGECLSSIAATYGFAWQTVYRAQENAELRPLRPNPNLLFAGDVVVIPQREPVGRSVPTGAEHTFRVGRQMKRLHLEFRHDGVPEDGVEFRILGVTAEAIVGVTDENGAIDVLIPSRAERARVQCGEDHYDVYIGHLDPLHAEEASDPRALLADRLRNLGVECADNSSDALEQAVAHFQALSGLPATGEVDADTLTALERTHGC